VLGLYHDEDALQASVVQALRRAGFDGRTVPEASMRGRSDEEQLAFATADRRVLYTKNTADYRRLDRTWRSAGRIHAGIVVLTDQRAAVGVQVRALISLADTVSQADMENRLEFLLQLPA
jgi:hypothetical protein